MGVVRVTSAEEWEHFLASGFFRLDVAVAVPAFAAAVRQLDLPYGVRVSEVDTTPIHLRRSSRLVKTAPTDDLLLLVKVAGEGRTACPDRLGHLQTGGAVLFDPARPYDLYTDHRSHELVVTFPRDLLAVPEAQQRRSLDTPISPSMPSLRALVGLVGAVARLEDEAGEPEELGQVSATLLDLLATVVRSVSSGPQPLGGARRAQLRTMQDFAMRELANPDLSVEMMAKAHGVSVRHISELFREAGESPAAFVRRQRLSRAHADLGNPRHAHRSIAEIARSWGVYDVTTFTRAFRRAYDVTPSEWRRDAPPPAGKAD
jgi:AraC family transcriptional activator of tynA and feaB